MYNKEYLIDIVAIDPKLRSHFIFAKKPLISFIIFINLSLIFYLTPALNFLPATYKNWVVAVAIILALTSLIIFMVFTRHDRVFVSRHSKVPLIRFYNNLPSKQEFKQFIQAIQTASQQRFDHLGLNLQQQRAGELKTIRRVQEQGGITTGQYNRAKNKLLNLSDK